MNTDMTSSKALFIDYYELTMAQGYFNSKKIDTPSTFELFYRLNPFQGGYAIAAGISDAIKFIRNFQFSQDDIAYLKSLNNFSTHFLEYLSNLRFAGEIFGVKEGSLIFPFEPIIQITGPLGIVQILETAILNIINHQSLIATKASRICHASKSRNNVLEFGLRRAQGDGGIAGSKAAVIGGCVGTSNVLAGKLYGLQVSGTHAHSWIQSFSSEFEAFTTYANLYPNNTTLLVDTYSVLQSGVPNAIKIGLEMKSKGLQLKGIRIDSGDLGWLAIQSAKMLDKAGLEDVKIVLSSDLDEYVIQSIIHQIYNEFNSKNKDKLISKLINRLVWGVGTNLITGSGDKQAAFSGVYKLVEINEIPVIKMSENRAKITILGRKKLWRLKDLKGKWIADVIGLFDEKPPKQGDTIYHILDPSKFIVLKECNASSIHINLIDYYNNTQTHYWKDSKARCMQQMSEIDQSHLRFLNPHIYKVSLTEQLHLMKQELIHNHSKDLKEFSTNSQI